MEPASTVFERLKAPSRDAWMSYIDHAFVRQLAAGTLPEPCFRHYLTQDYLFLIHFARAYGLAAFKAETLDDLRAAAAALAALADDEMTLHVRFCAGWGLNEVAMAGTEEAEATIAYTRYVLERGLAGDLLDLYVALAPCIVGYAEIGRRLSDDPTTRFDGNPYRDWIEMYAADDYQAVARGHIHQLGILMARRGGDNRWPALVATFRQATRLERAFWDMGLNPPQR
jgi:thiaminase/transcriptional activator TenA